jgi:hypothetical protein
MTTATYTGIPCDTRPGTMTVERAHQAMQAHLTCATATCKQRQAALAVLVKAGRYQLG